MEGLCAILEPATRGLPVQEALIASMDEHVQLFYIASIFLVIKSSMIFPLSSLTLKLKSRFQLPYTLSVTLTPLIFASLRPFDPPHSFSQFWGVLIGVVVFFPSIFLDG